MELQFGGTGGSGPRPLTITASARASATARPIRPGDIRLALAFLVLFALPFAGGGLWALFAAGRRLAEGSMRDALILGCAGLAFALVGFGLMGAAIAGRKKLFDAAAAALRSPDEPWKWREDWAAGHANDAGGASAGGVAGALGGFLLWNLISLPGVWIAWEQGMKRGHKAALVVLVFPVVGAYLAQRAVTAALRRRKYGASRLELDTVPVPVGRTFSGRVRTHLSAPPSDGFRLVLTALREERTHSGSETNTWTRVLWQEEAQGNGQLTGDAEGVHVVVPVTIRIPADAPGTDTSDADNEVHWRLEVRAATPGLDYAATFDVPIYRTAESALPETAGRATHLKPVPAIASLTVPHTDAPDDAGVTAHDPRSRIEVRQTAEGLELHFAAARNPGAAAGFSAFALLWTGAIALMVALRAPFFFPIIFGLFDALFVWIALEMWFGVTRIKANGVGVNVASGLGEPGEERWIPASDIADVGVAIGMQVNTTAYYDLRLTRVSGRSVKLGGDIRHKREAEWLARQILAAIRPADAKPRAVER